jgi:putative flavoprotein involved in K+ transport
LNTPANITRPAVLVIGAGPAGIASAYYLQRAGIAYQVVDSARVIASTWAGLYPSLRLNTSRFFSHLPGARFPPRFGIFPTAHQYHAYLVDFVARHRLNIRLGVSVERVIPDGEGWRVEMRAGDSTELAWFPAVITAAGRFANPYSARLPGLDAFAGEVLHAHDYHDPAPFTGKRVMVVGNGPSGMDIAVEIGAHNAAHGAPDRPALLAMRSGIILKPRYPYGLPKHGWMLLTARLPRPVARWLDARVEAVGFRAQARLGIKTPPQGQMSSAASTRGPELLRAVAAGQVIPVDGPEAFTRDSVLLLDGSIHRPDAVILATGYRPVVRYLRDLVYATGDQDWPLRAQGQPYDLDLSALDYRGTYAVGEATDRDKGVLERELAGYPGLYFVGVYYKGRGTLYNVNVEAEVAVAQIQARLAQAIPVEEARWVRP